eukprot:4487082-Amphidinium_carterae.1
MRKDELVVREKPDTPGFWQEWVQQNRDTASGSLRDKSKGLPSMLSQERKGFGELAKGLSKLQKLVSLPSRPI